MPSGAVFSVSLQQAIVYNDNDMQTKECGDMAGYLHEMNNTEFV